MKGHKHITTKEHITRLAEGGTQGQKLKVTSVFHIELNLLLKKAQPFREIFQT